MPANKRVALVAVFDDRLAALHAIEELEQADFKAQDVGFVIRGSEAVRGGRIVDAAGTKDAKGAAAGALTGGVVGGILAAATAVLIPGVGPVLAGGVLAAFFGGAIAGTAIGGILGAMTGLGISQEEAEYYDKHFQAGKAIVAVKPGRRRTKASEILRRHGGYGLHLEKPSPIETKGVFSEP